MKSKRSKWWLIPFIAIPVMYFVTQFIPYYNAGNTAMTSMWSLFWYPERNAETIKYIGSFYPGFRINEFVSALLITQLAALFILVVVAIKKNSATIAVLLGCWGLWGLVSFLMTRGMTFSSVMAFGGIAGILMLLLFLTAVVSSVVYLLKVYFDYKTLLALVKLEQEESSVINEM